MLPGIGGQQRILSLSIDRKDKLYEAYMPFIKNGGLFIPTENRYELGDEIFLLLRLMDERERLPVAGKVVWITPKGAEGNRTAGVGIQFSDPKKLKDQVDVRKKIEDYLVGMLGTDAPNPRPTNTL